MEAVHSVHKMAIYKGIEEKIIADIKNSLNDSQVKRVGYCQRGSNTTAHMLAKMATKSPLPQAWEEDDILRHILSLAPDL